jgi:hypothetical protein
LKDVTSSGDHTRPQYRLAEYALMPKFKVILERVDTVTKQAVVMVEAESAEEARHRILARIQADEGYYDHELVEVDSGFGHMTVEIRSTSEPNLIPRAAAVLRAFNH